MDSAPTIESLQCWLYKTLPLYAHIGAQVVEVGERTICRLPLNEANSNHFNAVHAALQFAITEMAGGLAVNRSALLNSGEYLLVVKSLNIEFHKPALSDVNAVVELTQNELEKFEEQLSGSGKAELELPIELLDLNGTLVASSLGSYHAKLKRPN